MAETNLAARAEVLEIDDLMQLGLRIFETFFGQSLGFFSPLGGQRRYLLLRSAYTDIGVLSGHVGGQRNRTVGVTTVGGGQNRLSVYGQINLVPTDRGCQGIERISVKGKRRFSNQFLLLLFYQVQLRSAVKQIEGIVHQAGLIPEKDSGGLLAV